MRLALITETYPPQINGVARTLGLLASYLRGRGDRVLVVRSRGGPGDIEASPDDLALRSVRFPFYREVALPTPPFDEACAAVDRFRPDLVHIATEITLGLGMLLHARRKGYRVVSSFHTNFDQYSTHYGLGWTRGFVWRYLRWFHNRTEATFVPTPSVLADLGRRGFLRLGLWPRGVDSGMFRPDRPGRVAVRHAHGLGEDVPLIGYVGRVAAEKNLGHLIAAWELVASRRPDVRFLIVGGGPATEEARAALGGRAIFAGYRRGDDLADHYAACDLFAFASVTETFGNVVLEAMSSGLPVIALRAGGVADVIRHEQTGRLLEPDSPPEAMAIALLDLIADHREHARLAAGARALALQQSWDGVMGRLRDRYQEVIDGPLV